MPKHQKVNSPTPVKMEHTEDFETRYSNNVKFESTVYDLKLVFGESDLSGPAEVIRQHTGITIPWPLAKLMAYYLTANVLMQEAAIGIIVPSQVHPPELPPPPKDLAGNPRIMEARSKVLKLRDAFIKAQASQQEG